MISAVSSSVFSATKYEKYIKYTASLIVISILLSPVCRLSFNKFDIEIPKEQSGVYGGGEKLMYEFLEEYGKEALEEYFFNCIFSNFGIKPRSVSISIESTNGTLTMKEGHVELSESDAEYAERVKEYLKGMTGAFEWTVS